MDEKKPVYTTGIVEMPGMRFKGKRVAVHSFTLPSGKQGRWESVQVSEKPTVLLAGFTKELHNLVLVRLFRFPVGDFTYELPGGNIEPGENAFEAARREFLEETGYATGRPFYELCRGWLYNGGTNGSFVVYCAFGCEKIQDPQRDEVEQFAVMEVVEKQLSEIVKEISQGSIAYDTPISHAITALIGGNKHFREILF
ncbi:MAG: hypothetical protein A3D67_03325 [Candidatus Lloydbacteria bacterium RIFCSPHIGHO2_02_FULL_51_22]|uniref:Nudix hydrolase domain-containing protein n=3 Tax=Candidatus Lloydiibacteriota TaxID=1817910 RepID=A0A1G2DFP7_9BACT|nr:MAG: hypothetical protein A3D67_03325 [Candidatus Lloydbacteria bacterium RIFCSPHIGHO2_02_FULL_51_22]OGZ15179.1 MAG: hypothetical protein A3J08_02905 [Candidatus Lloydbacteria bacterium RIFCSPLOWO2_02_FULL_51_11]OGZ17240.1 MAG: hypothetical protein A3G11_02915 [Candidatus Lloydbacteria bacterium RIFCSPLOWO2_12_FULL_51_9]